MLLVSISTFESIYYVHKSVFIITNNIRCTPQCEYIVTYNTMFKVYCTPICFIAKSFCLFVEISQ